MSVKTGRVNIMEFARISKVFFLLYSSCVVALSLGQFSKIHSFGHGNIYLFDLLIIVFDFFGLVYLLKTRQLKTPAPFLFLIAFASLGTISLLFTPIKLDPLEFFTSLAYPIRFLSHAVFANVVWNFGRLGLFSHNRMYLSLILSGLFLFLAGLVQLAFLPDLEVLEPTLGWDPHKNRMVSTFFDPNFLGMYFVICLAATLAWRQSRNVHGKNKKLGLFTFITSFIFLIGIFLTFSRSAWLALAAFIFFVGLKNKAILAISASLALLAVFAVPRVQTRISGITDPQDSASFRMKSWQNTWEIIKDNWVFGVGFNAFRYAQRDHGFLDETNLDSHSGAGSDSSLLLVWAISGIFGMSIVLLVLILWIAKSLKTQNFILMGLIVSVLINSAFINSLFYPQTLMGVLLISLRDKPKN